MEYMPSSRSICVWAITTMLTLNPLVSLEGFPEKVFLDTSDINAWHPPVILTYFSNVTLKSDCEPHRGKT